MTKKSGVAEPTGPEAAVNEAAVDEATRTGAAATSTGAEATSTDTAGSATQGPSAIGSGWLAALALFWLAVMLRSVQVSLQSSGDGALGITEAAYGLPALVSAALVGGAATGLALVRVFGRGLDRPHARIAAGIGAGLLIGVASAAYVVLAYPAGGGSASTILGATIAAGAAIGGAAAGIRASAMVGAGVAASLGVFLLTLARELFKSELLSLFGAGESPQSVLDAQRWLASAASLAGGLVAGLVAYYYLRWASRAAAAVSGEPPRPLRAPAYAVAGASTGAMMLLTEVITRVGGAQVLDVARSISDSDRAFQDMADASRINSGLMVLFVGALAAMLAFGRSLPSKSERATTAPEERPATPAEERPATPPEERPATPAEERPATPPVERPAPPPVERPAPPPVERPATSAGKLAGRG